MLNRSFYFAVFLIVTMMSCAWAGEIIESTRIIKAGENYTLPNGTTAFIVDDLRIEDNASLTVPPNVRDFELKAKKSFFGKNSMLIAKGEDGKPGEHGKRGIDVEANLGRANVRGLTINTSGGNGGQGLPGIQGLPGHDASCETMTHGQNGGSGSRGGKGGNGGDAGEITVNLAKKPEYFNIYFLQKGGAAGEGGAGGLAGHGGAAKKEKCGTRTYFTNFQPGQNGAPGATGSRGGNGNGSNRNTILFK